MVCRVLLCLIDAVLIAPHLLTPPWLAEPLITQHLCRTPVLSPWEPFDMS